MNNSTADPDLAVDLDSISLKNLANRWPADVTFIFVGILTTFLNSLIIVTIASSHRLRTRCYFLIANVSIAAIVYSASFAITGLKRIIRLQFGISEVKTVLSCNGEMFMSYFGQSACASLPLVTALDRLVATIAPIKYKNIGIKFVVTMTVMGWSYALIDTSFTFYGSNIHSIVLNCNLISTTEVLYTIQSSCAIAIAVLVVVVYMCVLTVLQYRVKACDAKSNISLVKAKIQIKVVKCLSMDSSIHLVTQVSARIGLALLPLFPNSNKWTSASYMRIIIFAGLAMTICVFLLMNKEFKKSFLNTFSFVPFLKNQVTPVELLDTNFFPANLRKNQTIY